MSLETRDRAKRDGLLGLKILVAVLGVLIVAGTGLVIVTVVHRMYATDAAPPTARMADAVPGVQARVDAGADVQPVRLAPGERIAGIEPVAGGLAVWVDGPDGGRVAFIDPATGTHRVLVQGAGR